LLYPLRNIRTKPIWDEVAPERSKPSEAGDAGSSRRIYDWDSDSFLPARDTPTSASNGEPPSTLSVKTRQMLDRLKKSTQALEDMNSMDPPSTGGRRSQAGSRQEQRRFANKL
jgi:hypothetical protein